ncbi:MAG: hypothetical protein Q4G49_17805 [Paracoccus sp. (in: a-proteobacteria)]|nr:hypothetical protein [Paracoccus sp. (in: a-proteobacteria)]
MSKRFKVITLILLASPLAAQDTGSGATLASNGERCVTEKLKSLYCDAFRDGIAWEQARVLSSLPAGYFGGWTTPGSSRHHGSTLPEVEGFQAADAAEETGQVLIFPPDAGGGVVFIPPPSFSSSQSVMKNQGPITPDGENGAVR